MRRLDDHEHDIHDIGRAEDDPSFGPAPFERNEFTAPHTIPLAGSRASGHTLLAWLASEGSIQTDAGSHASVG